MKKSSFTLARNIWLLWVKRSFPLLQQFRSILFCLKGDNTNGKIYKVHVDRYAQFTGMCIVKSRARKNGSVKSARNKFVYSDCEAPLFNTHFFGFISSNVIFLSD